MSVQAVDATLACSLLTGVRAAESIRCGILEAMRTCLCLLWVVVTLLVAPSALPFCSVPQPRLVCAEYFANRLVVEATLVQTRALHDADDPEGISAYVYTLRLNRAFRGKAGATLRIYEGNDSGRATFRWLRGKEYLLFLTYAPRQKAWILDGCGNSGPLSGASMALAEIAAIRVAHGGGLIQGVTSEQALSTSIPGVRVEAEAVGKAGRYEATTDEKGEFRIEVPAGQYVVRTVTNGFAKADISYDDSLDIQPGGCAQLQLARIDPK